MRSIRIVLLALAALVTAPAAPSSLAAQEPSVAPAEAAAPSSAAPAADAGASTLPRYTPPRTLRAYTHVFAAFAVAWVLLFGYVVFLARRFRRVEEQVDALARS
ncbi:MAG TPA: CcmD family protein [Longimicrobium sp.]|nr:CcmD family protein [Longimicrobium sp.]